MDEACTCTATACASRRCVAYLALTLPASAPLCQGRQLSPVPGPCSPQPLPVLFLPPPAPALLLRFSVATLSLALPFMGTSSVQGRAHATGRARGSHNCKRAEASLLQRAAHQQSAWQRARQVAVALAVKMELALPHLPTLGKKAPCAAPCASTTWPLPAQQRR